MSDRRLEELVDAHGPTVLNVALRITGEAQTAQDVYQEVFLAIWQRWHTFNGTVRWGAYLYRVTVRKALELAGQRRPVPVALEDSEPAGHGSEPDMPLRLHDLQRRLTESVAKLPPHQANVFVLSEIEGLDHAAVAAVLGCSRNSVRVSLHRAVRQLAREMSDLLD